MITTGFAGVILLYVGLTIAVVLVATVVLPQIFGVNQTTWDTGTKAVWAILGLCVVASLIVMIFKQ